MLGYWYTWTRDSSKQGTLAARVWRDVVDIVRQRINDGEDCEMSCFQLRQKPGEPRVMQASSDCGETWADVLDNTCCDPSEQTTILHRINPDTGALEISVDGGTTWTPDPEDPRVTGTIAPPLPDDVTDKRCQGAANVVAVLKEKQQALANDANAWTSINGIIVAILAILAFIGLLGTAGAIAPLVVGLAYALLQTGQAAFAAAFPQSVWDVTLCAIYCHTQADASYTAADVGAIKAELAQQLTGIASKFLVDNVGLLGVVGMTNAARSGAATGTADCSSCTCEACSMWQLTYPGNPIYGTIDTSHIGSDSYFDVATDQINANNVYYVDVRTPAIDQCCHLSPGQIEILTGGNETFGSFVQCCNAAFSDVAFDNLASAGCDCFMHLQIQCGVPFTARVHLEDCP